MPERNLRIIHAPNPSSLNVSGAMLGSHHLTRIRAEAERRVRAAFKEHKCEDRKKPPSCAQYDLKTSDS